MKLIFFKDFRKKTNLSHFLNNKKCVSPVVAVALLLVVSVVAVVSYQSWFQGYQSILTADIEQKSISSGTINVEYVGNDGILYVTNKGAANIFMDNIKVGGADCNISKDLTPGNNKINISICLTPGEINDVIIGTNDGLIQKDIFIGEDVYSYTPIPLLLNGSFSLYYKYFNGINGVSGLTSSGNDLYVSGAYDGGVDGYLSILDISNPLYMIQKDYHHISSANSKASSISIIGDVAYLFGYSSFSTYNISDKNNIVQLDLYQSANIASGAGGNVIGDYAYFIGYTSPNKLTILNISDPSNILELDSFDNVSSLINIRGVTVEDDLAYISMGNRLTILNISDPNNIVQVSSYYNVSMSSATSIKVSSGVAYIVASQSFFALNVSNPTNILYLDSYTDTNLDIYGDVLIDGSVAYVSAKADKYIFSFDISDPTNLLVLDSITSDNFLSINKLTKNGNYLYGSATASIIVLDVSNPSSLVEVNKHGGLGTSNPSDFIMGGDISYILASNGLFNFDASNLNSEFVVNSHTDSLAFTWALDMEIKDNIIYSSSMSNDVFSSHDVSDPSNILALDSITSTNLTQPLRVAISNDLAYVTTNVGNLVIIDITDPSNLNEVGLFTSTNITGSKHIKVINNLAYITTGDDRFTILDVSDINNIVQLDSIYDATSLDFIFDFAIVDNLVYLAAGLNDRLTILDISDLNNIVEISSTYSANFDGIRGIYVNGDVAYVGVRSGMVSVNISNPVSPSIIQIYSDLDVIGNSAFVGNMYLKGNKLYACSLGKSAFYIFELD